MNTRLTLRLSLLLACCVSATAAEPSVFPGTEWANASPESQGVDPAKLKAAVDYLDRGLAEFGGAGTLFIVRNGYAIWAGPECDRQYQIWWVNGVKPDGQRLWPGAPPRTFYANGLHNNVCIVVPEWNMVVTRTNGGRKDGAANRPPNVDEIWAGFFARLAEAISARSKR